MLADPYASNVLRKDVHGRLVADMDSYARDARIQPHFIWTPLAEVCGDAEVEYVRRFKFHRGEGVSGLCYVGDKKGNVDIESRMAAIAGALVRNFIRASVVTLAELFEEVEEEGLTDISCLLVPNFHVPKNAGGGKAAQALVGLPHGASGQAGVRSRAGSRGGTALRRSPCARCTGPPGRAPGHA